MINQPGLNVKHSLSDGPVQVKQHPEQSFFNNYKYFHI